jgi:hypothetical protein
LRSVATETVAKLDWPKKCERISRPSTLSAVGLSGRQPPKFRAQKSFQTHGSPA